MSLFKNRRRLIVSPRRKASTRAVLELVETRRHCDADNTIGGAVDLGQVATYTLKTGSINKASDASDFYKFTVPSGNLNFKLALTGLTNNADLYLYNSSKSQINSSKLTGTTSEAITKTALSAGTYYAEVRAVTSSSNYSLKLVSDFTGDTRTAARDAGTLSATKTYNEYVGGLDTGDYYKFKTTASGSTTLKISGLSADANLELLDSAGNSLAKSSSTGTTSDTITKTLSAGTYYAKVVPASTSVDAKYTLTLTPPVVDTDPGDTFDAAKDIGTLDSTSKTYSDHVGGDDNGDIYKFKFTKSGAVHLTLTGLNGSADIHLYNADKELAASVRDGTSSEEIWRALPAGTYYLEVVPGNVKGATYTLSLTGSAVPTDHFGDNFDTATPVSSSPPGNLTFNDYIFNGQDQYDFYKVNVTQPGNLTAFIYNLSDDLDLWIYDDKGVVKSSATATNAENESISYKVTTPGIYYIQVSQGQNGVDGSASRYDIQMHVPTDEAGDTRALAKAVTTPFTGTGQIGGFDKYDFYKVTVPNASTLVLSLSVSDYPATLALYDGNGGIIDFKSATTSSKASLSYFFHTGGTYYVAATSTSSNLSNYTMSIKTQTV